MQKTATAVEAVQGATEIFEKSSKSVIFFPSDCTSFIVVLMLEKISKKIKDDILLNHTDFFSLIQPLFLVHPLVIQISEILIPEPQISVEITKTLHLIVHIFGKYCCTYFCKKQLSRGRNRNSFSLYKIQTYKAFLSLDLSKLPKAESNFGKIVKLCKILTKTSTRKRLRS